MQRFIKVRPGKNPPASDDALLELDVTSMAECVGLYVGSIRKMRRENKTIHVGMSSVRHLGIIAS